MLQWFAEQESTSELEENQGAIKVKVHFSELPEDRSLVSMCLLLRNEHVRGFFRSVLHLSRQRA